VKPRIRLVRSMALAAVLALVSASCAVEGGSSQSGGPAGTGGPSTSAARLGLQPQLRPFYDALEQDGDWVLVEPQGWLFRPRVNTVAWRPYQNGHWEPSYSFGWVWESEDPFGWITDHYGFWLYDDFQGWLWKPYGAWAPSWVAWVQVGDYVGWAPLPPTGSTTYGAVPGGVFTYMPKQALAQTSPSASGYFVHSIPDDGSALEPIDRTTAYQGVYYNTGPDLNDVIGPSAAEQMRAQEQNGTREVPVPTRKPALSGPQPSLALPALTERTRDAWSAARREFVAAHPRGGVSPVTPSSAPRVAPPPMPPPPVSEPPRFKPASGPADTLKTSTPPDSVKKHPKHAKPKPPKPLPPPSEGNG